MLRVEREELVTAVAVIERFSDPDELVPSRDLDLDRRRVEPEEEPAGPEKRKPDGTPAVPEMILEVLLRPHLLGDPGMEPKEITAKIRERWWPDAPTSSIGPIAWRMWKEGRLRKFGAAYSMLEDDNLVRSAAEIPDGQLFTRQERNPSLWITPGAEKEEIDKLIG